MTTLISMFKYLLIVVLGVFVFGIGYFFYDSSRYQNTIPRNVYVGEFNVSGLDQDEFREKLEQIQKEFSDKTVVLSYGSVSREIRASDIGLNIDQKNLWETLSKSRDSQNLFLKIFLWLESFKKPLYFSSQQLIDEEQQEKEIEIWKKLIPRTDPEEGSIQVTRGELRIRYPQPGEQLDIEKTKQQVLEALLYNEKVSIISAPIALIEPLRDQDFFTETAAQLAALLVSPITLYNESNSRYKLVLEKNDLAKLISINERDDSRKNYYITIDQEYLRILMDPLTPQQARIVVNNDEKIEIIPSRNGFVIDYAATVRNIINFNRFDDSRKVPFAYQSYQSPTFSTQEAKKLSITEKVSSFTTYHNCCQDRVINIQRAADIINGVILAPGESFSLNQVLGERTQARGFKTAGTIIEGTLQDSVGGGISQLATTLHNAVYWGGYEVLDHKPHSIYFSRYPVGIEATLDWSGIDYVFRNDTENGVLVHAQYSDTSITISLYGYNHGRSVTGKHRGGVTTMDTQNETTESRVVISEISDRYNIAPAKIMYRPDARLGKEVSIIDDKGEERWSVNVIRKVLRGQDIVRIDYWPVHYTNNPKIIRTHPCSIPGANQTSCS